MSESAYDCERGYEEIAELKRELHWVANAVAPKRTGLDFGYSRKFVESELARAREDTRRLDFLSSWDMSGFKDDEVNQGRYEVYTSWCHTQGSTLREAIDAAMRKGQSS